VKWIVSRQIKMASTPSQGPGGAKRNDPADRTKVHDTAQPTWILRRLEGVEQVKKESVQKKIQMESVRLKASLSVTNMRGTSSRP